MRKKSDFCTFLVQYIPQILSAGILKFCKKKKEKKRLKNNKYLNNKYIKKLIAYGIGSDPTNPLETFLHTNVLSLHFQIDKVIRVQFF